MLKKVTTIMLLICMLTSIIPTNISAAASIRQGTCGEGVKWRLNNNTLYIYGKGEMDTTDKPFDPDWDEEFITNRIVIGSEITSIDAYAFEDPFGERQTKGVEFKQPSKLEKIGDFAFYNTNLTSIVIPSSVTKIGNNAFDNTTLETVAISDTVSDIGEDVFFNSNSLRNIEVSENNKHYKSVDGVLYNKKMTQLIAYPPQKAGTSFTIPDSVRVIRASAFANCKNLSSITIPDSVTTIGRCAFMSCDSLVTMDIPEGVTQIDDHVFEYCTSLVRLNLPSTIARIGTQAIRATSLAKVIFAGSEERWNKIDMGISNDDLESCNYEFNADYDKDGYSMPKEYSGTVYYKSGKGSVPYTYKDSYFASSAYKYNHNLARMSIRLALSAFSEKGTYTQAANATRLLSELEFDLVSENAFYSEEAQTDSIAVTIGSKKVAYDDGDYTVIAVAVRGGNYNSEWGGNFNISTDDHHNGFYYASSQVIEFLQDYLYLNNISGKVKIWMTSYSRGSAAVNLAAARIDENIDKLSENIELTTEDIYAYCFETPAGVINPDNGSGLYNNIFCIVNDNDIVPYVAMENWGFTRYGITMRLPSSISHSKKVYNAMEDAVAVQFEAYNGNEYTINKFKHANEKRSNLPQSLYLSEITSRLATGIGGTDNYNNRLQEAMIYIGSEIMGKENTSDFLNSFLNHMKGKNLYFINAGIAAWNKNDGTIATDAIYLGLKHSLVLAFKDVDVELSPTGLDSLARALYIIGPSNILTLVQNLTSIAQAHEPTLCMAWLDTIEEEHFKSDKLRTAKINCPVDVNVYDESKSLVASIINNEVINYEESLIIADVNENGQKTLYMPSEENYCIEIIATDDGNVTYSMEEYDCETGITRLTNYYSIPIAKEDTLTAAVPIITEEATDYTLTLNNDTTLEGEVIEDAIPYQLEVYSEGNGMVYGGGLFYKGEYTQVNATADEYEEFLGWYIDDELISTEADLNIRIEDYTRITAKFTESTYKIDVSDSQEVIDTFRVKKDVPVTINKTYTKDMHLFTGLYPDLDMTEKLEDEVTFDCDTTIYAKFVPCEVLGKSYGIYDITHQEGIFKGTLYLADKIDRQEGVLIVAFYDEDGRLANITLQSTKVSAGENEINIPVENEDYISYRIMLWKDLKGMDNILEEL